MSTNYDISEANYIIFISGDVIVVAIPKRTYTSLIQWYVDGMPAGLIGGDQPGINELDGMFTHQISCSEGWHLGLERRKVLVSRKELCFRTGGKHPKLSIV